MIEIDILNKLNAPTREERLANLKEILKTTEFPPMVPQYINNHIHTTYSFSPYSPTAAVYAARMEGLCTAGIIDHDSISGAREFLAAAELIGMPVTVGNILSNDLFYDDAQSTLAWQKMGVLAVEMESAALYMNAARAGKNALAICTISDHLSKNESLDAQARQSSFTQMMEIALDIA